MRTRSRLRSIAAVIALAAVVLHAGPALALITGSTDPSPFLDPESPWHGADWRHVYRGSNASYTAIGYFTLLTAAHDYTVDANNPATGERGTLIPVGEDVFEVMGIEYPDPDPGQTVRPDMKVLHLRNTTEPFRPLPGFYNLYRGSFPNAVRDGIRPDRTFVLVGTGNGGEGPYRAARNPYGQGPLYYYTDSGPGTRARRWGTNELEGFTQTPYGQFSTSTFWMNYDVERFTPPRVLGTEYEAGFGDRDSGGALLVNPWTDVNHDGADDADRWVLAGMGLYRFQATTSQPNSFTSTWAANLTDYAGWLEEQLRHDVLPGDLDADGDVDSDDYITLKRNIGAAGDAASWLDGDFDRDGTVTGLDLAALRVNMGYASTPHDFATVAPMSWPGVVPGGLAGAPEPGTLLLLAPAALAALRRRRRSTRPPAD